MVKTIVTKEFKTEPWRIPFILKGVHGFKGESSGISFTKRTKGDWRWHARVTDKGETTELEVHHDYSGYGGGHQTKPKPGQKKIYDPKDVIQMVEKGLGQIQKIESILSNEEDGSAIFALRHLHVKKESGGVERRKLQKRLLGRLNKFLKRGGARLAGEPVVRKGNLFFFSPDQVKELNQQLKGG